MNSFQQRQLVYTNVLPTAWMKSGTHLKDPFVPMKADGAPAPTHLSDSPALPGY